MHGSLTRREVLAGLAATAGGASLATAQAAADAAAPQDTTAPELSAYSFGRNVWVRVGGSTFCCYRGGDGQKYPYMYPLLGPASGLPVTDETAEPWPHHRSLFFACDHVNGGNYWQGSAAAGQIVSQGPRVAAQEATSVTIADVCDWRRPGAEPIITDERTIRVSAPDASTRLVDWKIDLKARTDIAITKTNHSFFSMRAARGITPDGGGELRNADGATGEKATFGQTSKWCGFSGERLGHRDSIVIMGHPANPWYPCRWFTRDYGFASPTPFFWLDKDKPWQLPAGKTLSLRYRVAVLAGAIDPEAIDKHFERFAASTT